MPAIPRKPPRVAGLDPDPRHAPFRVLGVGDPGSGKSTIGKKLLVDVLARRDMAVVLDIGGDMLEFCRAKAPPGTPISSLDGYAVDGDAPNVAELLATGRFETLDLSPLRRERFDDPARWVTEDLHI